MKRATLMIGCLAVALAWGACSKKGGKKGGESGEVWKGPEGTTVKLVVKDLARGGLPGLTMKVPKNAEVTAAPALVASKVVQISNDMGFTVWVWAAKLDLAKAKASVKKSSLRKFKAWVSKSKDAIVYKTASLGGETEYHVQSQIMVGGKAYVCRDATSASFSEQSEVDQMLAACRTLKKK